MEALAAMLLRIRVRLSRVHAIGTGAVQIGRHFVLHLMYGTIAPPAGVVRHATAPCLESLSPVLALCMLWPSLTTLPCRPLPGCQTPPGPDERPRAPAAFLCAR